MLQFRTATTCTIAESPEPVRRGNIRRVRLTLHAEGNSGSGRDEAKRNGKAETEEKSNTGNSRKRNGFLHPDHKGTGSSPQHLSNGLGPETSPHSRVYGVVQRADASQAEVVVYEWSVNQLKEEMNYIKEVRHSLEKVRQQMFGEFSGMKEKIQELKNEMKISEARQESLQKEVRNNSSSLEQCSQMNKSMTALTINMQKSLLVDANKRREEMEELRKTYRQSLEQVKEKDQQIEKAQAENQILKLKIESSQEANVSAIRDMTRKLYNQYEAKLKETEQQHQAEMEAIQSRINQAHEELEEANKKAAAAEQKIAERDQRIQELDQLIARMVEERHLLQQKLQEQEQQLRQRDRPDSGNIKRSQKLEEEAASLRERIRHLDNMVHCQQRKVKQMIEEVEILRNKIQQKDATIEDLMERISFLEAENKELQDKLDYMMSVNQEKTMETREVETKDQAVSCDIPIRITPVTRKQTATTPYMRLMELSAPKQTAMSKVARVYWKVEEYECQQSIKLKEQNIKCGKEISDKPEGWESFKNQQNMTQKKEKKNYEILFAINIRESCLHAKKFENMLNNSAMESIAGVDVRLRATMSTAPTERQGPAGDLRHKSKAELLELLRRQKNLQGNRRFVQSLPDKGERIAEFIKKLEAAISRHEEAERATELLSALKLEFQKKQHMITSDQEEILRHESTTSTLTPGQVARKKLKGCGEAEKDENVLSNVDGVGTINRDKLNLEKHRGLENDTTSAPSVTKSENSLDSLVGSQRTICIQQEKSNHVHLPVTANDLEADFVSRADLLSDRLDNIALTDNGHRKVPHKISKDPTLIGNVKFNDNPFQALHHQEKKRPNYIDILEHRAKNPVVKRAQFKTNHPMPESPSSSPDQSPGRSVLMLSPAERKLRDRKHLDEITAARLPPLHHSPAQLLSLEESGELQILQKQKYESTQAKLAAEKLVQRLDVKVMKFGPEAAASTAFRGYRDREDSNSSDEDLS
ncbi:uncharacterized protein LOC144511023 [Mustelus asterias]